MESNPSVHGQQLQRIDFPPPECWCESTGHYTNSQEQEFAIRVRGASSEMVEEYTKNLRVDLEVVPANQALPEETEPNPKEDERTKDVSEDELKSLEHDPKLDLEIAVEIVDTHGIEPPYVLRFLFDPSIAKGAVHHYTTANAVTAIGVTVSATLNGVATSLYNNAGYVMGRQADTYPPDPPNRSAYLSKRTDMASRYSVYVTGLQTNNSYTISSSASFA